jgi:hypothetical protein
MLGAIVGYLSSAPPPTTWSWAEWMQAISAVIGIAAGKLATSPLPGAAKTDSVKPDRFIGLLVLVAVLATVGCAKTPAVTVPTVPAVPLQTLSTFAVQAERAGKVILEAQRAEIAMHQIGWVPDASHQLVQRSLLGIATAMDELLVTAQGTAGEQSIMQALTRVQAAVARFESDVDVVPNANVRGVLASISSVLRLTLGLLPRVGVTPPTPEALDFLRAHAPLTAGAL